MGNFIYFNPKKKCRARFRRAQLKRAGQIETSALVKESEQICVQDVHGTSSVAGVNDAGDVDLASTCVEKLASVFFRNPSPPPETAYLVRSSPS